MSWGGAGADQCPADPKTRTVTWAPSARAGPPLLAATFQAWHLITSHSGSDCLCLMSSSAFPAVSSTFCTHLSLCSLEKSKAIATKSKYREAVCFL